ncbi:MAG: glycoside hydrolase family 3 C-terminal domain-containing protein [Oscillospiraceae bacterium]|jgi:beta-glucosidase|nr:glycoside hydrolase family 3 C-terminal domain-containing protein [Oscillospiraceae bacterium]
MKYEHLVSKLTIREKARLLTGKDFWHLNALPQFGMPNIMLTDGPHGLRKISKGEYINAGSISSTCFPTACALSCTWDRDLIREMGNALGDECIQEKVSVLLGPGINIKRSPLCGRNFEYFSEDPVLAGELAASLINGVQEKNVGTSLKHFAANSTEVRRFVANSLVDERALREIYLRGFEIAVKKSRPWTVMTAYNKINGVYCTENEFLQNQILRDEWGFKGLVLSDWTAVVDRVKSLNAGLDLEMPASGYVNVYKIAKAYRENEVTLDTVDKSAGRVLDLIGKSEKNLEELKSFKFDREKHHSLARKIAQNSVVLLKNQDKLLPVNKGFEIAVIGTFAVDPVYQGMGSSKVNAYKIENAYDTLKEKIPSVQFAKGYEKHDIQPRSELIQEAVKIASSANTAIIFAGSTQAEIGEGLDRKDMKLNLAQTTLIEEVCKVNHNVVVVLSSGYNLEMPWHDKVKAILQSYLIGENGGPAIADILVGDVVPCGKLPESYPMSFEDMPASDYYYPNESHNLQYRESIYVGYRYFEKAKIPVLFPFGHGLSYTTFKYSDMMLNHDNISAQDSLEVKVTVENTGKAAGQEIVQIYVSRGDTKVFRPQKELKGFQKVRLKPGEKKEVTVVLDRSAFEYYSMKLKKWCVESGEYTILAGASSADIREKATVYVDSFDSTSSERDYSRMTPSYYNGDVKDAPAEEFELLLDYYLDAFDTVQGREFTKEDILADAVNTKWGGRAARIIKKAMGVIFSDDEYLLSVACDTVLHMPLIKLVSVSSGAISDDMLDSFIVLLNGGKLKDSAVKFFKGIVKAVQNVAPLIKR